MVHSLEPALRFPLYFSMKRIRMVEEEIVKRYAEGKMRCPTHLSIGQESVPGVLSLLFDKSDYCVSTHRGHAHFLAKGGSLDAMIAEIYGKETGCSKGKGGSMHLADATINFMGTSAIVGNSIPVGVGLALACHIRKTPQISFVFLGDGATEEGVFFESVNFAVLRNLPVIFVCENNLYSVYSGLSTRQPKDRSISRLVESFGLRSHSAKGSELQKLYNLFSEAITSVRLGCGPQFIEISTYRWREHCGPEYDNHIGYRTQAEFEQFKSIDPLAALEIFLLKSSKQSKRDLEEAERRITDEIKSAFAKAESAPFPKKSSVFEDVYS